jgi:alkanesulfonate monooxygenase SsuD/methylene tetrahydromethanopterin reductase-like flavin-dependent oxidoreductase (luciferase family)
MDVGVGLPMKAMSRDELVTFVRTVEDGPFDSVSLGQRLTFDSADPMIALTFVAAVTERIRLLTSVLCVPYHKEGVLAQQASVQRAFQLRRRARRPGKRLRGRP